MENESPYVRIHPTHEESFTFTHSERDISYFTGGWWMHDVDRAEMNRKLGQPIKANHDTKQIEIDRILYPTPAEWEEMQKKTPNRN